MAKTIAPTGKLDLAAVTALREELLQADGSDIVLDLTAVTFMGALCLQCCIAAAKAARNNQTQLTFAAVPETVAAQMTDMGMPPHAVEGICHAT